MCEKTNKTNLIRFFKIYFFLINRAQNIVLLRWWSCRCTDGSRFFFAQTVFLKLSHEGGLVDSSLEATMSEFGTGINEFKIDLL